MNIENYHVPKIAWLTVNRTCQMRCKWCYAGSTGFSSKDQMSLGLAKELIELVKSVGIQKVIIIGGEPTLWKNLFEFNDFCRSLDLRTIVVSNCQRFGFDNFWNEYLRHHCDSISPSLKAFDVSGSLDITGFKDFESVRIGMVRVCESRKTQISIVYSSLLQGKLTAAVKMATEVGASRIRIAICNPMFVDGKYQDPYSVEYRQMVREICETYEVLVEVSGNKLHFTLNTPWCIWPKSFINRLIDQKQIGFGGCQFQHRSGVIFDTDGSVILCNSMFGCKVGKFRQDFDNGDGLNKLLNSEQVNSIYNHINAYPHKKCIDCSFWSLCRGGCPIQWTTHSAEEVIPEAYSNFC